MNELNDNVILDIEKENDDISIDDDKMYMEEEIEVFDEDEVRINEYLNREEEIY